VNSTHVLLPNGLPVSILRFRSIHSKLVLLKEELPLRFLELMYFVQCPNRSLPPASANELFVRGIFENSGYLDYVSHIAILYLIEGRENKISVITLEKLEKFIKENTP